MIFLLDTNTVIYYFKGIGGVVEQLLATPPDRVALSTVTLFEIEVGLEKLPHARARRRQLAELEAAVKVLPLGRTAARAAAAIRGKLEMVGQGIGPLDTLIAGIAFDAGATLVTHNMGEFSRVDGLKLVDWY